MTRGDKGQAVVEVALMIPLLLIVVLGVIELSNAIDTYMVLSELTREGASMTSRGTPADVDGPDNDAMDVVIAGAAPAIDVAAAAKWKVIYSRVGPSNDYNNPNNCADNGDAYVVLDRSERGGYAGVSQVGEVCGPAMLPDIDSVDPGQTFHVMEVYYDYASITGLDHYGIDLSAVPFYRRSVF